MATGSAPDLNDTDMFPVWDDDGQTDVQSLFKNPYFAPADHRTDVANSWYEKMKDIAQLYLYDMPGQANNVYASGNPIYSNILGGSMPLPVQYFNGQFPPEACEKFRLWYNQGGRLKKSDPNPGPNTPDPVIPPPANQPTRPFVVPANPVWDAQGTEDDIKMCFTDPCWIPGGTGVAKRWRTQMMNFQYDASVDPNEYMDLQKYEHVKGWARNIYTHVASQSMPISAPYFSDEACEAVRLWYNQGCAQDKSQVGHTTLPKDPIPPDPVEKPFRMRKDINTLTEAELTTYRMQVLKLRPDKLDDSTWQVGGFLHANWCLHYMEASFPWHRAHLLWLETQICGPIPYWNFFSSKASDHTSPDSGIPQAFLDDTFKGPDGKVYPNPLRHALARNGVSRESTDKAEVQRAQPFVQPEGPIKRTDYIKDHVPTYLDQLYAATQMTKLGDPQEDGYPFTWLTTADPKKLNDLTVDNNKAFYANVQDQFDGVLEQAHDNFHGWAGPDMANNSYAAFDPLFWSFHANFDRIFEGWIRKNDQTEWSSNFPLRPFIGREGTITVSEGDKYTYRYTTIGNMVINSKALGYTFAPPGNPDYNPPPHKISMAVAPMILFPNVKCTDKTYIVHVALNPNKDDKPLVVGAPGYVGSITRLGMGPDNGNDRCIKGFVVRRLEATKAMNDVGGLTPNTEVPLKLQVLEDNRGVRREVPESEYRDWPGFRPLVVWGKPVAGVAAH
jgi:hypothetical protein